MAEEGKGLRSDSGSWSLNQHTAHTLGSLGGLAGHLTPTPKVTSTTVSCPENSLEVTRWEEKSSEDRWGDFIGYDMHVWGNEYRKHRQPGLAATGYHALSRIKGVRGRDSHSVKATTALSFCPISGGHL